MREDLDDDEYAESKADTLKQMEEFEQSLSKMLVSVHMSLVCFSMKIKHVHYCVALLNLRQEI